MHDGDSDDRPVGSVRSVPSVPDRRPRRGSVLGVATACLVAAALAATTVVALGIDRRVLDTQAWIDAVAPLAEDPRVLDRIAGDVTEAAIARIDLVGRAEDLPLGSPLLDALATAVAEAAVEAARPVVRDLVRARLDTTAFRSLWAEAARTGHEALIAAVRGPVPPSGTTDVVLDVAPLMRDLLEDDVDPFLARALPDDLRLPVTIVAAEDLARLRTALRLLRALGLLAGLALVLTVATTVLAARRRAPAASVTLGAAAIGGLIGARWLAGSERRVRDALTATLTSDGTPGALSELLATVTTGLTVTLVVTGVIVVAETLMAARTALRQRPRARPAATASSDERVGEV